MRHWLIPLLASALLGCSYDWTLGPSSTATDGGSSDGSTAQTTFPPSGLPACTASSTDSCDCASGTCTGNFALGNATVYCRSGATCNTNCTGGACKIYCESGATCDTECAGGMCAVTCLGGAKCGGSCSGGSCSYICAPTSTCNATCAPMNCTTTTQ